MKSHQLTDAAMSTAAHYRAVCRARSRADFINKLSGAVEEVDESAVWLEILTEADIAPRTQTRPLWIEAEELTRILVRSRETARARRDQALPRNQRSEISNQQLINKLKSKITNDPHLELPDAASASRFRP
jgi:four helix bundle protein